MFGLLMVVLLVLANGFFVATEFAVVAVRRSRLEQLEAEGRAGARVARQVVERLDFVIAACQFGITISSLGLGWIGEPALSHLIEPPLVLLIGSFAPYVTHTVAFALAFGAITALHIVIGELAPKGLALQRAEATTLFVARPIQLFSTIFHWPIAFLNGVGNASLRLIGLHAASGHEMVHSVEELRLLVSGSQKAGLIEPDEAAIVGRAFGFGDLTVSELMVPRTEVLALALDTPVADLMRITAEAPYSRFPVYDGTLDDVLGVVHVKDLYHALERHDKHGTPIVLKELMRPVPVVPGSLRADKLLSRLRRERRHLAIVMDEYGGTAGIVTLEDLLEEIVGQLDDEFDPAAQPFQRESDGTILVDGLVRLGEAVEELGLAPEDEERADADTIAGLVLTRLGRAPALGDRVDLGCYVAEVVELDGLRIAKLHLRPKAQEARR
ncbi:MAG: HlyC/CorC family transporter [Chloroflexi bacterium]|nr:HlyC/CorC family transporter [Chloroflexota bacterium]